MPDLLKALVQAAPPGYTLTELYLGPTWTMAVVQNPAGEEHIGLAATPPAERVAQQSRFFYGFNDVAGVEADALVALFLSDDQTAAAIGLATLNAVLEPDPALLSNIDAGDWLVENGRDKSVAMIGRFPLADEVQPIAKNLWIFELQPQPGEYGSTDMARLIPQVDILAITSSTLINHTLSGILAHAALPTKVMLIGPSTPLHPALLEQGIDLLCGVQVVDKNVLLASITSGVSFRKMQGVRRVSMSK